MKKINVQVLFHIHWLFLSVMGLTLSSCGSDAASAEHSHSTENKTSVQHGAQTKAVEIQIDLPTARVEFPELAHTDRDKLNWVKDLESRIIASKSLRLASDLFEKVVHDLEKKSQISMNGTNEDRMKAILQIVDAFKTYDQISPKFVEKATGEFIKKYGNDEKFSNDYRELYKKARDELSESINPVEKRAGVLSVFRHAYKNPPGSDLHYFDSRVKACEELRAKSVQRVLSSASTDMMVADYKKGKDLTDLLLGTKNSLKAIQKIQPNQELSLKIQNTLSKVQQLEVKRQQEIVKARESYRFPERYKGANLPSNAKDLESKMKKFLQASKASAKGNYQVKAITTASTWIDIVHPLTGVHLYSQIDFYVAAPSSQNESGVLDILYVTGKTGGPHQKSFATFSVGGVGQMLEKNLN